MPESMALPVGKVDVNDNVKVKVNVNVNDIGNVKVDDIGNLTSLTVLM